MGEVPDGLLEPCAIELDIEPHHGLEDDVDIEGIESDTFAATAIPASLWRTIASESSAAKSNTSALRTVGETTQARCACSDGHGHVEREEGLAALRLAANDADGLCGPKAFDEPALFFRTHIEFVGETDGERAHRRLAFAAVVEAFDGAAKTSKKSFSSSCRASFSAAATSRS